MKTYHTTPTGTGDRSIREPYFFQSRKKGGLWRSLLMPAALLGAISFIPLERALAQAWETPYTAGSDADLQLRFMYGSAGSVTAPNPVPPIVVVGYNYTSATGTGNGWGLSTSGSTAVGTNTPPLPPLILATSNARTLTTGTGALRFDIVNGGALGELASVSLPMTWSAQVSVTGSDTWVAPSDSYVYQFDALLNNTLLSANPDIFGDITLTISAGSEIMYNVTGLAQILGVVSLFPENYGVQVGFTYDQSDGPLLIRWSASSEIGAQILGALGTSDTMYEISSGAIYVNPIPEPGTYAFLIGGVGLICLLRRRNLPARG